MPRSDEAWLDFVEHVAEALDVGPGTRVFDCGCGAGDFLLPLFENGYLVGGIDPSPALIDQARSLMPAGRWVVGGLAALDPGEPWDVVLASNAFGGLANLDTARGLLARMTAKATHAVAALNVPDREAGGLYDRAWFLRALSETGARAVQFEDCAIGDRPGSSFNVFARVG